MLPSSIESLPSVWDSDQTLEISQENATVEQENAGTEQHSMDKNDNIRVDNMHIGTISPTRSLDEQLIDAEFLIISDNEENKENNGETKKSYNENSNRGSKKKTNITKETGVHMLRKKITPELHTDKRLKKVHQQISYETSERDREMKEEIHQIRMKILKKELEIKENQYFAEIEINTERLKAAKAENEMRVLEKQFKEN